MKKLSKFLLLYEEVMKSIISIDTFKYKFEKNDIGEITCTFETLNKKNELVNVKVKILPSGKTEYEIINGNEKDIFDEKKFMLNFYKDYEKFKEALKEFNEKQLEENNKENEINQVKSFSVNGKEIPNVQSFELKLKKINDDKTGKQISAGSDTFIFKNIDDKLKNLIQVNFTLINNDTNPDNENELSRYNAIALIKLLKENSVIIKVILTDPDNKLPKQELSETEFHDKFNDTYDNLREAIDKFEQEKN